MNDHVAPDGDEPHDPAMEARVAVLEEIARSTKAALERIERDVKAQGIEMRAGFAEVRGELQTGLNDARDRHDRDFRLTFAAIIFVALGLAGLLARGFHWF